ncbi:unnamed protein product [Cunninghamella blakesleeana]
MDFFSKHQLANTKDTRLKYGGRIGQLYKNQLEKRVQQDINENPNNVVVEIPIQNEELITNKITQSPLLPAQEPDTNELSPTTTEIINDIENNVIPSSEAKITDPSDEKVKNNELVNTNQTTTLRTSKPRVAKRLGAKSSKFGIKKVTGFNFEEAEASAKKELEIKQSLGYEDTVEDDSNTLREKNENEIPKALSSRFLYTEQNQAPASASTTIPKESSVEKLGFGMTRLNINETSTLKESHENYNNTKEKFGNARAISSDQYFGRNEYDPSISAAQATRLNQFSNATSISSSQYFGREDNEDHSFSNRGNTPISGSADWDGIQDQAINVARKFVGQATADLEAVKDLAENATSKVDAYLY